jgi:hypothetical protein
MCIAKDQLFIIIYNSIPFQQYTPYPNMLRKSAVHQKKVDSAVRVLQTTTGAKVPWAMILAGFLKSDIANEIVRQQVQ